MIFSFELSFPSALYKIANKPSKYTFKKDFNKVGTKTKSKLAARTQSQAPPLGSSWEPEDVEKVITQELREIQETLMVGTRIMVIVFCF